MCMAASLVFATPIKVFGVQLPEPVFAMVPAFAWGVIRPSILAPFVLLAMGVFLDALWGTALGFWALCLLATYTGVVVTRSMMSGQSSAVMWVWYGAVTALGLATGYVFTIFQSKSAPGGVVVLWQFAWTAILYPFAHRLIDRFEDADVRFR